jgi:hypothetical protein
MSTSYPTSLQDLDATRGTASQPLSSPSHVTHHTNEDDTIEALEAKVGIDNSAVTSSIDYKLKNSASINPGHKHTLAAGISDVTITTPISGNGLFYNGSAWVNQDTNVADASTTVKGVTKMSTAPASPTNPIAVGDNDTRVPSQGENDALVGTSGTPSSSNKYVTNDDTATAATASKVARRLAGGNITVVTESQGNNSTNAASTAYVDTFVNDMPTQSQVFVHQHGQGGSSQLASLTTAYTGFSTTEPIFAGMNGGSSSGWMARFIKLSSGSIILTHQVAVGGTAGQPAWMATLGNYVYAIRYNNPSTELYRFDKADLTNGTLMTVSGTNVALGGLFSDGTYLYNVYSAGSVRKYSVSGTTATEVTTDSYTSIVETSPVWCDGTYIYECTSGNVYRWTLGSATRTSVGTFNSYQWGINNAAVTVLGLIKESGNTTYAFIAGTDANAYGRIIPTTTF